MKQGGHKKQPDGHDSRRRASCATDRREKREVKSAKWQERFSSLSSPHLQRLKAAAHETRCGRRYKRDKRRVSLKHAAGIRTRELLQVEVVHKGRRGLPTHTV